MRSEQRFFEIGARTNFSFLEGAARPEEMVFAAGALNLSGIGIADRNTMAGVVRAHNYLREMHEIHARQTKQGVKADEKEMPAPCRFQPGARLVFSDETPDILAYPCNRQGWANLCRLLSRGNLRTTKGSCILEEWDILEWGANMMLAVVVDPVRMSDNKDIEKIEHVLGLLRGRFGDAVYLVLSPIYDGRDAVTLATLAGIATRTDIPLIATNQPLYHVPDRKPLSDVVTAIREHVTVATAGFHLLPMPSAI